MNSRKRSRLFALSNLWIPKTSGQIKVIMVKTVILLIGSLLALSLGFSASGQLTLDSLSGQTSAAGVAIPLYVGLEQTPSMIIRADRVFTDYERKGFFRIGFLPQGVMEGVTFEIYRPAALTNSFVQLHDWLGSPTAKHFEFRKVSFVTLAGSTNRLESGRARIFSADKWELLDGVRFYLGTNQLTAPKALLQLAGSNPGLLIMATTPPTAINLFATKPIQTIQPQETP